MKRVKTLEIVLDRITGLLYIDGEETKVDLKYIFTMDIRNAFHYKGDTYIISAVETKNEHTVVTAFELKSYLEHSKLYPQSRSAYK